MKLYVRASRGEALVGIWWYTDNRDIWALSCPVDSGVLDGVYVQYSDNKNHMNMWNSIVKEHVQDEDEQQKILAKGYRSIERGRVIYNTATMSYEVTCSNSLINDKEFRSAIASYFQLEGNRYEFVALNHYGKLELTGNPAVDSFIENNQF